MRLHAHARVALMVAWVFGCSDASIITIAMPDDGLVASAIIATKRQDEFRVFAIGVSDRGALMPNLGELAEGPLALELVLYDEPLSVRSIPEGELLPSDGTPPERQVPASARVYATTLEGDRAEAWFSQGRLSTELAAFRFRGSDPVDPCTQFVPEVIELHPSEAALSATTFSEDELVVFTTSTTYAVRRDSIRVLPLRIVGETRSAPRVLATTISANGRHFGSLSDGTLVELAAAGAEVVATVYGRVPLPADKGRWLAVGELGSALESYVLTSSGALFREHQGTITVLHQFHGDETLSGAVSLIGPEEALAVYRYEAGKVLHYSHGHIDEETVPTTVLDRLVSLAHVPVVGTVTGTDDGKIFRREDEFGWVSLVDDPNVDGLTVTSLDSDPAGFSFGAGYADNNVLGRWIEAEQRVCVTQLGPIGRRPRITRLGGAFALLAAKDGVGARVIWLRPAE